VEKCEEQRRLHAIQVQVTRDILSREEDLARHGFIEKGDQGPQDYHAWERQRREAERAERRHRLQDGSFRARHAQQVAVRRALLSEEQRQEQRRRHAQQVAARRALLSEEEHQKQRQLHANEVWVRRHLLLDHQRQQQRQRDAQQVAARRAARRAILTEEELEQQRRQHAEDERLRLIRHSHPNCDEEVRRWHPHYNDEQVRNCILTEYLSGDFRISDKELLLQNEYIRQLHAQWDAEDAARREQLSPEDAQQEAERQQHVQLERDRQLAIHLAITKLHVQERY
jgi:dTMP kinase